MKTKKLDFPSSEIEEKIGYSFKNKDLLEQAFTRKSYSEENPETENNELLEFIGDSVIGVLVVKHLSFYYTIDRYGWIPDEMKSCYDIPNQKFFECELDEAELSELKIKLVQRSSLSKASERRELEKYLRMGTGDVINEIQNQDSVKEDLLEALVGAVAIDSNWDMTILEELVLRLLDFDAILEFDDNDEEDYEGLLSNWFKKTGRDLTFNNAAPICKNLKFAVSVDLGFKMLNYHASGYGMTEKGARRMAAKRAISFIRKTNDRTTAIIKAVGMPDPNRAVNQLQELYQKKMIPKPIYTFSQSDNAPSGNPEWGCSCIIEGLHDDTSEFICASKIEAKRAVAYDTLLYLMGTDTMPLFFNNITKIESIDKENIENE